MRKNIIQTGNKSADGRTYIDYDWFPNGIPANIKLAENVYIDTSYGFSAFHSKNHEAMILGKGSGCYDRATFISGANGSLSFGEFNILNGTTFICNKKITVGSHCMFAWGSVVTDSWIEPGSLSIPLRRKILKQTTSDIPRMIPYSGEPDPVIIEDNVWIGFDAVVLPGVRLGRGSVIGSKSIITKDVPPYAIIVGNPARIIRYLEPDDTAEKKSIALHECLASIH
jgi:acetyltransferase-like isoleucine patch superfamily enzyme